MKNRPQEKRVTRARAQPYNVVSKPRDHFALNPHSAIFVFGKNVAYRRLYPLVRVDDEMLEQLFPDPFGAPKR